MSQDIYRDFYKNNNSLFDLPDYKITGGKECKGKRILVVGVGTGRDVWYLVKDNDIYGLDVSKDAIRIAKSKGIKSRVFDVGRKLPFRNEFFDVVVAKDIFEHLEKPELLRDEIYRVLKRNGYAVISVPNHFYFPFRLKILFGGNLIWKTFGHDHTKLFEEWNYMHIRFFTWKGLKRFLSNGGFKIVRNFWDFGTLAHYNQPEMVIEYLSNKYRLGLRSVFRTLLCLFWSIFNLIFPRSLRYLFVSLSPSFFTAGFYVWVKKLNK